MIDIVNPATPLSLLDMVSRSSTMAKFVLLLLLVFSVVSWAIILTKFIAYRKARQEDTQFLNAFAQSASWINIYNFSKELQFSPVARVFMTGYYHLYQFKENQGAEEHKPTRLENLIVSERDRIVLLQPETMVVLAAEG